MRIYKKYNTQKNKQYNILAKEYIQKNNIKCKYYGYMGMGAVNNIYMDYVLIDGNVARFNINNKELLKREALLQYSPTDY